MDWSQEKRKERIKNMMEEGISSNKMDINFFEFEGSHLDRLAELWKDRKLWEKKEIKKRSKPDTTSDTLDTSSKDKDNPLDNSDESSEGGNTREEI